MRKTSTESTEGTTGLRMLTSWVIVHTITGILLEGGSDLEPSDYIKLREKVGEETATEIWDNEVEWTLEQLHKNLDIAFKRTTPWRELELG